MDANNTQANAFNVLMEMIWEGGAAYDLTFPGGAPEGAVGEAHNANHMLAALFPNAPKTKIDKKEDEDQGHFVIDFPDGSQCIVYENGDGIEMM